jgi:hypothetical protein
VVTTELASTAPRSHPLVGQSFLHPIFDYAIVGGVLSLALVPVIVSYPEATVRLTSSYLPALLLLTSSAHFAASTLRLYTKPGAREDLRFLTMLLPGIAMAVLLLALMSPAMVGAQLQALYLTWSPYHYAAQAFGLAVMYCYRSRCEMTAGDKRALWCIAMLPFVRAFLGGANSGLGWFVPRETIMRIALLPDVLDIFLHGLTVLTFVLPIWFVADRWLRKRAPVPLITLSLLLANGIWWVVLDYVDAFVWATIFHGVQYLAITAIFHVKDRCAEPTNTRSPRYHAVWFYGVSVALGYALFYCWPYAYVLAGFGVAESMLLVIAVINIHHFIVDRYIWRLGGDRKNYRHVSSSPSESPAAVAV